MTAIFVVCSDCADMRRYKPTCLETVISFRSVIYGARLQPIVENLYYSQKIGFFTIFCTIVEF